ncbi:hypothetical protein DICSQDRAFT_173309 [Dichomitus squalens LYAD-421 SS1]|uniref:Fungal-type protein kinase domain-containing protein n=1 Tax=Dichomitus squalens (strain LYAD-421) TaxID=732165 RepID=R7SQ66_DICSQ|nr:uncharacterized protein DICSQDRAFT_173309 [Dichomitus squalens LYAD-421 SS1]EJF58078.1 hypothetical protein DICSQDRAFT_173309 [Dichomitus squalens LYAD-421 SS1]
MGIDSQNAGHCVGQPAWATIVGLIEVKHKHRHCAFDYKDPDSRFVRDHADNGQKAFDQFIEDAATIFAHQHRTHIYALYVYRDQARICFFDRSGGVVSTPFHYGTKADTTFQRFFYRLAGMSREQLGFDPTAVLADESVVDDLRAWAAAVPTEYLRKLVCEALCWDPTTNSSSSAEWPTYEVTFKGKMLYVGRAAFTSRSPCGRCTRGYVAIERETDEDGSTIYSVRYLKDSWRRVLSKCRPEYEVYARLAAQGVMEYILTCLGGEDVLGQAGVWQQTRAGVYVPSEPSLRGHYRILLKEVCRPLSDFQDYRDLALILGDALSAHRDAWVKAGVLHRDVSYNNILIYETHNDEGQATLKGLLTDWDLAKYKEDMDSGSGPQKPDGVGTWYFRSAVSKRWPTKPYTVSDDIESFVHVYHYCVLRFHATQYSGVLVECVNMTYGQVEKRVEDGAYVGGFMKFSQMCNPHSMITPSNNKMLQALLQELAKITAAHYATIDVEEYDRRYNPAPQILTAPQQDRAPAVPPTSYDPAGGDLEMDGDVPEALIDFEPLVPPRLTLHDYMELLRFFRKWGTIQWRRSDCIRSSQDLFKKVGLAPSKDNAFESSQSESSQLE